MYVWISYKMQIGMTEMPKICKHKSLQFLYWGDFSVGHEGDNEFGNKLEPFR